MATSMGHDHPIGGQPQLPLDDELLPYSAADQAEVAVTGFIGESALLHFASLSSSLNVFHAAPDMDFDPSDDVGWPFLLIPAADIPGVPHRVSDGHLHLAITPSRLGVLRRYALPLAELTRRWSAPSSADQAADHLLTPDVSPPVCGHGFGVRS